MLSRTPVSRWTLLSFQPSVTGLCRKIFLMFAPLLVFAIFVVASSTISRPKLSKGDSQFIWQEEQQEAFDILKLEFQHSPVLTIFNPALPSTVIPDCSNFALGAILRQPDEEGLLHAVDYMLASCAKRKSITKSMIKNFSLW